MMSRRNPVMREISVKPPTVENCRIMRASPAVLFRLAVVVSHGHGADLAATREELIANGRNDEEIAREIGADQLIYQDLAALIDDVRSVNPAVAGFEDSCFSGNYITGDVTQAYLDGVEAQRRDSAKQQRSSASQLDLNLEVVD